MSASPGAFRENPGRFVSATRGDADRVAAAKAHPSATLIPRSIRAARPFRHQPRRFKAPGGQRQNSASTTDAARNISA